MADWFVVLLAFLFGAAVGSFVNVCIYRLPRRLSIIKPPSHCPYCGMTLSAVDLVPLFSYLWLGGKCRHCKTPISPRYFFVELLTALSFIASVERFQPNLEAVLVALSLAALIVIAFVDLEFFIVPDEAVWALGIFGFMRWLVSNPSPKNIAIALSGALISGFIIWAIGVLGRLIFRKEAMGFGDVKIAAAVGVHLGATWFILPFFIFSTFVGVLIGIPIALLKRRSITGYIPFGPALAIAAGIVFLAPPSVINFVLSLYSISS